MKKHFIVHALGKDSETIDIRWGNEGVSYSHTFEDAELDTIEPIVQLPTKTVVSVEKSICPKCSPHSRFMAQFQPDYYICGNCHYMWEPTNPGGGIYKKDDTSQSEVSANG